MKLSIAPTFFDTIVYGIIADRKGVFSLELVGPKGEVIYKGTLKLDGPGRQSGASTFCKPQNKGKHQFIMRDDKGEIVASQITVYIGNKPKITWF